MRYIAATFAALALAAPSFAGELTWGVSTVAGIDTNPAGYSDADAQGLGWSQLSVGWENPGERGRTSLAYKGSFYSFVPNTDWTAHQHGGEISWSRRVSEKVLFGAEGGARINLNRPAYEAFDYHELSVGGFARFASAWPVRLSLTHTSRSYGNSPEFDYGQYDIDASVTHTFPTRTSVKLSGELASRDYAQVTYLDLLGSGEAPTSWRWQLSGRLGQGLTESLGLKVTGWLARGEGQSRWRDDYWQVMEDPLANSGIGGTAQLSWLAPLGVTVRGYTNAERREESYVDSEGYDALRLDRRFRVGTALEGVLPWVAGGRAFSWTIDMGATVQRSDDALYSYERFSAIAGLGYRW